VNKWSNISTKLANQCQDLEIRVSTIIGWPDGYDSYLIKDEIGCLVWAGNIRAVERLLHEHRNGLRMVMDWVNYE
jgi:hypothetical protein